MRLISNKSKGVLASPISDVATSLTLATGQGARFPACSTAAADPDDMTAWLDDGVNSEVVLITSHTLGSDTFTVTRAFEKVANAGPTAYAFAAGAKFESRPSADLMDRWVRRIPRGRIKHDATATLFAPGVPLFGAGTYSGYAASRLYYFPIVVDFPMTIDALYVQVTTGSQAGGMVRLGISKAKTHLGWAFESDLLADTGLLAVNNPAVVAGSITPITLQPGRYFLLMQTDASSPAGVYRYWQGFTDLYGQSSTLANNFLALISKARTMAALPSTVPAPDTFDTSVHPFYSVLASISDASP